MDELQLSLRQEISVLKAFSDEKHKDSLYHENNALGIMNNRIKSGVKIEIENLNIYTLVNPMLTDRLL